jgi:hypothetical protein
MEELALIIIYSVLGLIYACTFLVAIYLDMYAGDFSRLFRE